MNQERLVRFREGLKKYRVGAVIFAIGSAAFIVLASVFLVVYIFPTRWSITDRVRSMVPLPAVVIGYHDAVPMNALQRNLLSLKRFYEAQDFSKLGLRVDFSTDEGKMRLKVREREIANKMVEDAAIRMLAEERGIVITEADAAKEVANRLNELGGDKANDVKDRLNRLYGWDLAAFEEKVVVPGLYGEALQKSFEAEAGIPAAAKSKIDQAKQALADGQSFADVAKEFSLGRTATDGGDFGWFLYDDLAPEIRDAAEHQSVNLPGDVIESSLGFHILLVLERKTKDGQDLVRLAQIFSPKQTFTEWLSVQMSKMPVRSLVSEYVWNPETARVEFRDPAMRDFEKHLFENSQGDAAFLF